MKKIIAMLSLVCFTAASIHSFAGGNTKESKGACCQKGAEGKACCKDAKACSHDGKSAKGEKAKTTEDKAAPATKK